MWEDINMPVYQDEGPYFVEADQVDEPVVHHEESSPVIQFASSNVKGNKLKLGSKRWRKLLAVEAIPVDSPKKQYAWHGDIDMDVEEMNNRFINAKL